MSHHRALYLSLAVNGLLLATVAMVWNRETRSRLGTPLPEELAKAVAKAPIPPLDLPAIATSRWSWRDVESSDYPTYICNLRNVACPEETIRDIIMADLASLYRNRRQELAGKERLTEVAEETLQREEAALLTSLLDSGDHSLRADGPMVSAPRSSKDTAGAGARHPASRPQEVHVVMPVVMAEPSPALGFTEQQKARLDALRKEFIAALGGENQNPNDPAYLGRWTEAQPRFDERFKTAFGGKAFAEQQAIASRLTVEEETQAAPAVAGTASQPRFDRQIRLESGVHIFR